MYKILHYSDARVENFDVLYEQCDILITTGDLTLFDFGKTIRKLDDKPAFGVYGNHCSGTYFDQLGIFNLHNRVVECGGLKWGGFQGCLKYKDKGIMFTEEEAKSWSNTFPYVDVLLLHVGPRGMLDDVSDSVHSGSEYVRKYVLEKKPKVVFVGHQYSNDSLDSGSTKLYRSYGARIIEI